MTKASYWESFKRLRGDIDITTDAFYTYIKINNLALENKEVYNALNKAAAFWNLQTYSLHNTFFVFLFRIFDTGKDVQSIHKFLAETMAHPEYFSKQALAIRKADGGEKPEWLDKYLENVREPSIDDLKKLRCSISSYDKVFKNVYMPIRNKVIAHSIVSDKQMVAELFEKALYDDVERILYYLNGIMDVIWQLYHNGREISLGSTEADYKERIGLATRDVLQSLGKTDHHEPPVSN
jgi:hypothetical protein